MKLKHIITHLETELKGYNIINQTSEQMTNDTKSNKNFNRNKTKNNRKKKNKTKNKKNCSKSKSKKKENSNDNSTKTNQNKNQNKNSNGMYGSSNDNCNNGGFGGGLCFNGGVIGDRTNGSVMNREDFEFGMGYNWNKLNNNINIDNRSNSSLNDSLNNFNNFNHYNHMNNSNMNNFDNFAMFGDCNDFNDFGDIGNIGDFDVPCHECDKWKKENDRLKKEIEQLKDELEKMKRKSGEISRLRQQHGLQIQQRLATPHTTHNAQTTTVSPHNTSTSASVSASANASMSLIETISLPGQLVSQSISPSITISQTQSNTWSNMRSHSPRTQRQLNTMQCQTRYNDGTNTFVSGTNTFGQAMMPPTQYSTQVNFETRQEGAIAQVENVGNIADFAGFAGISHGSGIADVASVTNTSGGGGVSSGLATGEQVKVQGQRQEQAVGQLENGNYYQHGYNAVRGPCNTVIGSFAQLEEKYRPYAVNLNPISNYGENVNVKNVNNRMNQNTGIEMFPATMTRQVNDVNNMTNRCFGDHNSNNGQTHVMAASTFGEFNVMSHHAQGMNINQVGFTNAPTSTSYMMQR